MDALDCRGIEERLPWLLNGTLAPEERRELEVHLSGCAACTAALAATRRTSDLYAAHPEAATLVDYAFGLPSETEPRAALELHLAHCLECQEELRLVGAESQKPNTEAVGAADLRASSGRSPEALQSRFRGLALAATVVLSSGLTVYVAMRDWGGPRDGITGRVAVVELLPEESRTRGDAGVEVSISAAENYALLLVSDRAETFEEVRVRIVRSEGGRTLREESGLLPALGGGYALLLRAGATPQGELDIELEGRLDGAWLPLGRYRVRVTP